jgi:hypothetical protein
MMAQIDQKLLMHNCRCTNWAQTILSELYKQISRIEVFFLLHFIRLCHTQATQPIAEPIFDLTDHAFTGGIN